MNANIIKMPLIRVAHPSQQECEQELNKVERLLQNAKSSKNDSQQELSLGPDDNDVVTLQAHGKRQAKDEIIAGAPRIQHPPSLFNFEHHFDKELTPRKGWQQQVNNLNSMLEYEKERYRNL